MDPLFHSMAISASGLTAERFRMTVVANNIANLDTTATADGTPFRRQAVVVAERAGGPGAVVASLAGGAPDGPGDGVEVLGVVADTAPAGQTYDPGNPLADARGYVTQPNGSPVLEMVDLMNAAQHYRANVTALQDAKAMVTAAIQIGKGA